MQPAKRAVAARAQARARMYMHADLGWLGGFPTGTSPAGITWRMREAEGFRDLTLDRAALHRATKCIHKLRTRFPVALPKVVGNVERWQQVGLQVIEALKPTVHDGEDLPVDLFRVRGLYPRPVSRQASRLIDARPGLGPLVAARSWSCRFDERAARRSLDWMEAAADPLETLLAGVGQRSALDLSACLDHLVAHDGPRRVLPLIDRLGQSEILSLPVDWGSDEAKTLAYDLAQDRRPTIPRWSQAPLPGLLELLPWLCSRPTKPRRHLVRLLICAWPGAQLEAWAEWRREWHRLTDEISKRPLHADHEPERARRLRADARALADTQPRQVVPDFWLPAVRAAQTDDVQSILPLLSEAMAAIPARHPDYPRSHPRQWFMAACVHGARGATPGRLRQLRRLIQRARVIASEDEAAASRLVRWLQPTYAPRAAALRDPRASDEMFVECEIMRRLSTSSVDFDVEALIEATDDLQTAIELGTALVRAELPERWQPEALFRAAAWLSRNAPDRFIELVRQWEQSVSFDEQAPRGLVRLTQLFDRWGAGEVLRLRVEAGLAADVLQAGFALARSAGRLELPRPRAFGAEEAPWIPRFPRPLHDALAELAWARDDAEAAATRILGKDCTDPARLEAERAAIAARLQVEASPPEGLERRLANLEARISAPKPLSEARARRLSIKLRRAAAEALWTDWKRRFEAFVEARIRQRLALDGEALRAVPPARRRLLFALTDLEAPERRLAARLISARAGPKPWDLREEPWNQAFIQRSKGRGLDMAPWLDGVPTRVVSTSDGTPIHVGFEDDPYEIFEMGGHFRTCLSPGAFNFFSVVANAADVNKRVVYARRPDGRVIGRCLLALTNTGGLLTFHPYCHDADLDFAQVMKDFVREVCKRVGAVPVPRGEVVELVARKWYDDGPRDLFQRFAAFNLDSDLARALRTLPLEGVRDAIVAALAPLELSPLTWPIVLSLLSNLGRSELIVPLWPELSAIELPDEPWTTAMSLALDAGLLSPRSPEVGRFEALLARRYGGYEHDDVASLERLVRLEPSLGLRVLRRTRPRDVRASRDEWCSERIYLIGLANEGLQRTFRARRAYARALEADCWHGRKSDCEARLAALGGPLSDSPSSA